MKTVVEKREIERSDNFQESEFKIKANGKAFKILSDGLYSDKIKAIIRELSCNAYDAHVEAGTKDIKFDIHLPTKFSPEFYIRDYGTGLSKEDIENIYTTYFESTKTESNDAIGCLGLGSKSPFSYVNMFSVTSFFNGMQYVYSALLNEHGTPSIILINESETEEKNGLKVQFSVKKEDIDQFRYKAEDVFFYFKSSPNFLGNTPLIRNRDYIIKNNIWGLSKNRTGNAIAIMGNVAYPVNLDKVDFSYQETTIIKSLPVDLFFNIGDLEVSASREGLSYDERTTNSIRGRIQKVINHEKSRIEKKLLECKCYWDAVIWLRKEKANNRIVELLFRDIKSEYNGKKISDFVNLNLKEYKDIDPNFLLSTIDYKEKYSSKDSTYKKVLSRPNIVSRLFIKKGCTFFINDCENKATSRIRKYFESNENLTSVILIKTSDKTLIDKFMETVGIIEIKRLSDIEPPKNKRAKNKNTISGNFVRMRWLANEYSDTSSFWKEIEDDKNFSLEDGGFYIPINRWKTIYNDKEYSPKEFLLKLNNLFKICCPNDIPTIYGIKKAKLKLVEDKDNWISWIDYAQEIVKQHILSKEVFSKLEKTIFCGNENYGNFGRIFLAIKGLTSNKLVDKDIIKNCSCDLVKELAQRYCEHNENRKPNKEGLLKFWNFIESGYSTLTISEISNLRKYSEKHHEIMKKIDNKYPLIKNSYIPNMYNSESPGILHIFDYINAISNYKK